MAWKTLTPLHLCVVGLLVLASCGGRTAGTGEEGQEESKGFKTVSPSVLQEGRSTIWDLFKAGRRAENVVQVNRYIWAASIEVLDFLPIQTVDPYTGVIVTGYGTPPGGGRAYRATVLIDDPALDARSLTVALQTRGGPASASTVRAIEDAILTRARQMRVGDNRL